MAETVELKRFHIEPAGEGFAITVEASDGQALSLAATREQVDLIADTFDELLSQSDEDDVVEGEG